jgi:hypothetical protein
MALSIILILIVFLLAGEWCGQARFFRCRSSERIGRNGAITPDVLPRINWTIVLAMPRLYCRRPTLASAHSFCPVIGPQTSDQTDATNASQQKGRAKTMKRWPWLYLHMILIHRFARDGRACGNARPETVKRLANSELLLRATLRFSRSLAMACRSVARRSLAEDFFWWARVARSCFCQG